MEEMEKGWLKMTLPPILESNTSFTFQGHMRVPVHTFGQYYRENRNF